MIQKVYQILRCYMINMFDWGIIGENEKNGGKIPYFKAGVIFDTRSTEANPMKGIWTEILFFMAPEISGKQRLFIY